MLINFVPGEECRIAIVEGGKLEEFYHERASAESHVGNIYKGKVINVEPAIQAAFVDFGLERNGFLHTSDLHPKYFPGKDREEYENIGHKTTRRDRPPIQRCLKRGDEVLVQVLKEGIGTKGPTVTSYLSVPGRFLVMMPDMKRLGVSRKNEDDEQRKHTRDLLKELNPPEEFGFIVRTAGVGQPKTDLKRDLAYLTRLWKRIDQRRKQLGKKVGELYTEQDLIIRTIRDVFTNDIERIVFDNLDAAQRASEFLSIASPRHKTKIVFYDDPVPLFHRFGIEKQIENIGGREVELPSGGRLVIDSTEALVAIDVNSGKSREARDAETNALRTNEEAVDEIARQLRLRDLGGIVVLDLIDMGPAKHRKQVENRFKNLLKNDRARTRVGSISAFGLLEMTRQRMRPDIKKAVYATCLSCEGRGFTKSVESVVLSVMRRLSLVMHRPEVSKIELTISPDVAFHVLNRKRSELSRLEERYNTAVLVRVGGAAVDFVKITAYDARGVVITGDLEADAKTISDPTDTTFRELERDGSIELDEDETIEESTETDAQPAATDNLAESAEATPAEGSAGVKKKRRRRRGRGRKGEDTPTDHSDPAQTAEGESTEPAIVSEASREQASSATALSDDSVDEAEEDSDSRAESRGEQGDASSDGELHRKKRRRRRRRRRSGESREAEAAEPSHNSEAEDHEGPDADYQAEPDPTASESVSEKVGGEAGPRKKRRRRRRRGKGGSDRAEGWDSGKPSQGEAKQQEPPAQPSRGYHNRVLSGDAPPEDRPEPGNVKPKLTEPVP
jgi:ribonuclease E